MRFRPELLLAATALSLWAGVAYGTSIPITGTILDVSQSEWSVGLTGPGFSVSTNYFIPFSPPIGAPPVGELGTINLSVGMSDYESPVDGTPTDAGSLNGVAGIIEGEIDFGVTYNPSPAGDPTGYADTITGIPVALAGDATGYTCAPALPDGCLPGTELWTITLSGTGDATIVQTSGGLVESVEIDDMTGEANIGDPPVPATEPSALPFTVIVLSALLLLCRRYGNVS